MTDTDSTDEVLFIVTEDQFDTLVALLNEPVKDAPKLRKLLSRPVRWDFSI